MAAMPYCPSNKMRKWGDLFIAFKKKKKKRATKISGTPERMGRLYQGPYAMHISKYQLMIKVKAIDFQLPQWLLSLFAYAIHGIYSASDVCQNRISQMLENIEGAANSQDDIII